MCNLHITNSLVFKYDTKKNTTTHIVLNIHKHIQALSSGGKKKNNKRKKSRKESKNRMRTELKTTLFKFNICKKKRNKKNAYTPNSHANSYDETKQTFLTEVPGSSGIRADI